MLRWLGEGARTGGGGGGFNPRSLAIPGGAQIAVSEETGANNWSLKIFSLLDVRHTDTARAVHAKAIVDVRCSPWGEPLVLSDTLGEPAVRLEGAGGGWGFASPVFASRPAGS